MPYPQSQDKEAERYKRIIDEFKTWLEKLNKIKTKAEFHTSDSLENFLGYLDNVKKILK